MTLKKKRLKRGPTILPVVDPSQWQAQVIEFDPSHRGRKPGIQSLPFDTLTFTWISQLILLAPCGLQILYATYSKKGSFSSPPFDFVKFSAAIERLGIFSKIPTIKFLFGKGTTKGRDNKEQYEEDPFCCFSLPSHILDFWLLYTYRLPFGRTQDLAGKRQERSTTKQMRFLRNSSFHPLKHLTVVNVLPPALYRIPPPISGMVSTVVFVRVVTGSSRLVVHSINPSTSNKYCIPQISACWISRYWSLLSNGV